MRPSLLPFLSALGLAAALECHPEGALVPPPTDLAHSKPFQRSLSNLTDALDAAVRGGLKSGFDPHNVSFSVGVVSLDQSEPGVPLWEYHHLAPTNVNGTKSIDRNSQYLIGSVSKVISDAILIRSGVNLDDPITEYFPSLKNSTTPTRWENITLRGLSSHLGGIAPHYGFSEYYYIKEVFEGLGFPHLNKSAYAPCGIIGLNAGCTQEQFLDGMLSIYPVAEPMTRPVYSNTAFTLYIYALQSRTGKNYTELVHDFFSAPLNTPSTFPSPGDDNLAVIPASENSWGSDYGDNAPAGGLVSTLADLSTFVHSVLDGSALGTPTAVREWLQPRTFAGSPHTFVGAPWEIFRPPPEVLFPSGGESNDSSSSDSGDGDDQSSAAHTVSFYTKDGAAFAYHARISVVEEYGIGLVALTAGGVGAATLLHDAILGTVVPAADRAAKEQTAAAGYVGTFVGTSTPETGSVPVNVSTTIDAASLRLDGLFRNGTDMRDSIHQIWVAALGSFLPFPQGTSEWRVHPAGVSEPVSEYKGRKVVREAWRVWPDLTGVPANELPGAGMSDFNCMSWTVPDWIYYGGEPTDRYVFVKDAETGEVLGLDVPFLRTGVLERVKLL